MQALMIAIRIDLAMLKQRTAFPPQAIGLPMSDRQPVEGYAS